MHSIAQQLYQRFLRYTAISSQSDEQQDTVPTSIGQLELANLLQQELTELFLVDIHLDQHAVLTAKLPANLPNPQQQIPAIGFIAHLDTADISLSSEIKPQLIKNYNAQDICLNQQQQIYLTSTEYPEILAYQGDDIICTDGTSVLGADDKAAISIFMQLIYDLQQNPNIYHGDLYFAFVPDEEIGLLGAKLLDLNRFPVTYAYTLDCCALGEVVYETFNAAEVEVKIQGVAAHPMSAKNVLLNPTLLAIEFANQLDPRQTPECTEGKEGYIWLKAINSNQSYAQLALDIRDHNIKLFQAKKELIQQLVTDLQTKYPRAKISYQIKDVYRNIYDYMTDKNKPALEHIFTALNTLNIPIKITAMRGGTDGSYLSSQGIFTPNLFTGAHNFHSNCEFLPMSSFVKAYQTVLEIVKLVYQEQK